MVVENDGVMRGEFRNEFDRAVHSLDHDVEVCSRHRALFGDTFLEVSQRRFQHRLGDHTIVLFAHHDRDRSIVAATICTKKCVIEQTFDATLEYAESATR